MGQRNTARRQSLVALVTLIGLAMILTACGRGKATTETAQPQAAVQPAAASNAESAPLAEAPQPPAAASPVGTPGMPDAPAGGFGGSSGLSSEALTFVNETVDTLLAEALGISSDTLQAAQEQAMAALPNQGGPGGQGGPGQGQGNDAPAQPDNANPPEGMTQGNPPEGMPNGMARGGMPGGAGFGLDNSAYQTALAEALGISTEDLAAATAAAYTSALAQAVEQGYLTQEGADLLTAQRALQAYSTELGDGRPADYTELVQAALTQGVLTEAQATLLLENVPTGGPNGAGGGN
jgi:hypothetical protein